jgi:hypothetical protein
MSLDPLQALQAANRAERPCPGATAGTLLIAGATGALGQELLRRLAGSHRHATPACWRANRSATACAASRLPEPGDLPIAQWPLTSADTRSSLFDPPRLYHDRERALWVPSRRTARAGALAARLRRATLAIVQPHDQGRCPRRSSAGWRASTSRRWSPTASTA